VKNRAQTFTTKTSPLTALTASENSRLSVAKTQTPHMSYSGFRKPEFWSGISSPPKPGLYN